MTNYHQYNVEFLRKLREENPNSYSKIIARDPDFVQWLKNQITFVTEHIPEMVYAVLNPDQSVLCGNNQRRKFRNINVGWLGCGNFHCVSCSELRKLRAKQTNLEKYGVANPAQNSAVKQKAIKTNLLKYGEKFPTQARSVQEKIKNTNLKKYGVDHYWKTVEGQQKRKQTIEKNWGSENPSKNSKVKEKRKSTFQEKYGVDYAWQNKEIRQKAKNTMKQRWGVDNPSFDEAFREKAKQTMLDKFGVEYASRNPFIKEKIKNTTLRTHGVRHVMHDPEIKQRAIDQKRNHFYNNLANRVDNVVTPLFDIDQYQGVNSKYQWKCNNCASEFEDHLDDGHTPQCPRCFPRIRSQGEEDVYVFIKSIYPGSIVRNSRSVISPLELDIFLPEKNLAFEYNGVFRHSELGGCKDKNYHLKKTLDCESQGIRLIQILDCEWLEKTDIVKSRISNILGISKKIHGRKCQIVELSSCEKSTFLEENHIQGNCNSSINLGLTYDNTLVAVMTFGKTRYSKSADYELLRYANLVNCSVQGGASKLLKYFEKMYNYPSIVSYSDRRWNTGNMYKALGFKHTHSSKPNYWYWKANSKLESRIKYQKHKLKNLDCFNSALSEWEIMKNCGYDRIWDCGNHVFLKNVEF